MKKDNVFQAVMRVLKKNSQLRMGVILLIVLLCVAFFAPIIAPCDPYKYMTRWLPGRARRDISWALTVWAATF